MIVSDATAAGKRTLQEIADHLNVLGIPTARGGKWSAMTVLRLQRRLEALRDDDDGADEFDA